MSNPSEPSPEVVSSEPTKEASPSPVDVSDDVGGSSKKKRWVKFDEEGADGAATIEPSQAVHVDMQIHTSSESVSKRDPDQVRFAPSPIQPLPPPRPLSTTTSAPPEIQPPEPARLKPKPILQSSSVNNNVPSPARPDLHFVPLSELPPVRQCNHRAPSGFYNGDIVVTALPTNQRCAWVTKAEFKPELVPEELMAPGLTLTVEEYVMAMQVLVNDVRFNLYNICYKRILIVWIMLGFFILLCLLFSGVRGLALFGGGIVWLILNAIGIFVCMWLKFKLYHMLERCMASINSLFYKHKILLGLDDRGKISCHKVHLIFVYFDVSPCIKYLHDMLENQDRQEANARNLPDGSGERSGANVHPVNRSRMDIDTSDIIITGTSTTRVSQREKYAEKLMLRYSQRWVKEFVRKRLDLNMPVHPDGLEDGPCPPCPPRHCSMARCPCQFIEEHLRFKPLTKCSIMELCF